MAMGKIPWRDKCHDAERLANGIEKVAGKIVRDSLAAEGVTDSAEETENVDGTLDFALALDEVLPSR